MLADFGMAPTSRATPPAFFSTRPRKELLQKSLTEEELIKAGSTRSRFLVFFESSFAGKDPMCIFQGIDQKYLIESSATLEK
jgi:hypothetical protein